MRARIYQPTKNAMHSGRARTKQWVLEYEPETPREIDPLMGWTSSSDMLQQVQLEFETSEEAVAYAKEHGLPEDPAQLAANPEIRKLVEDHVEEINKKFARVEQVKKISILPRDLSQEDGELTPTLKVKRAVVTQKHEKEIEELYAA